MSRFRTTSLAFRVTAIVSIATTLVFLAFGQIVVRSLHHHFAEQDAGELAVVADSVQRVLGTHSASPGDVGTLASRLAGAVAGHHGVYFYVAGADGRAIYKSLGLDLTSVAHRQVPAERVAVSFLQKLSVDGKTYRTIVLRMTGAPGNAEATYRVAIAGNMDAHLHYIARFQETLWLTTVLMCAIALLSAWLAVRQGHAPIRKISARIRSITSSQLHVRLDPRDIPIELVDLVDSFNDMLGQVEDGFQRLSNFSTDIAHELRTPVTNLTTETQVALSKGRSVEEYREILYSNLEEFERMSKMISDMLFLAKADNDPGILAIGDVDLAEEVQRLFQFYDAWADDKGVSLKLEGSSPKVKGDALMLRRALGNLLSNAIRHSPRGKSVRVRLDEVDGIAVVRVINTGTEIAEEHLPKLFDRFYRVDSSRHRTDEGAGLGLAIVKSIVTLHHGKVSVSSKNSETIFQIEFAGRQLATNKSR